MHITDGRLPRILLYFRDDANAERRKKNYKKNSDSELNLMGKSLQAI